MKTVFGPLCAAVSWLLVVGGGIGFAQVPAVAPPAAVPGANANPLADLLSMAYHPKDTGPGAIRLAGSSTLQQAAARAACPPLAPRTRTRRAAGRPRTARGSSRTRRRGTKGVEG